MDKIDNQENNEKNINLKNESNESLELKLFLDVIGGHSFIIRCNENLLYKSTSENEAKFYEFINSNKSNEGISKNNEVNDNNDSNLSNELEEIKSLIPKYFGRVSKSNSVINNILYDKEKLDNKFNFTSFNKITEFKNTCFDIFKYLLENDYKELDINIENDTEFSDKIYPEFKQAKYINYSDSIDSLLKNKTFICISEQLKSKILSERKLKWMLFRFVKWHYLFLQNGKY